MKRNLYMFFLLGVLLVCMTTWGRTKKRIVPPKTLYGNRLDTLTFGERFSLKTNGVDWLLLTPNLGVDFTLGNMNWSRWTLGVSGRYKPSGREANTPYHSLLFRDVRIDIRRYMHTKRERLSWFAGIYGTYGKHDVKLNETGYDGHHIAAGLTGGLVMPLYGYRNGSSLDLEFSGSVGVMFVKHDEYRKENDSYITITPAASYTMDWSPVLYLVGNNVLRVSLVYHFGQSVSNRYKRRVTVDEHYRLHLYDMKLRRDSIRQANTERREFRRDSLDKVDYERRFEKQRLALEKAFIADSLRQVKKLEAKDTTKVKKK